jgi:hypothetical protein
MALRSTQVAYAANLQSQGRGLPIYRPFPFAKETFMYRAGDVGFFDQDGQYQWVLNAFNRDVLRHKFVLGFDL